MTRLPLLADHQVGPPELVADIVARRGGALLELDRLLLHSPPVAAGWNALMGNIRNRLQLDPMLRELAICAVAILNGADYELHHHAPPFLQAGGRQEQLAALAEVIRDASAINRCSMFDARERAVLQFVSQCTLQVKVDEATFAAAREALGDDRLMFELVATTASYNMVSRILVAVQLHS